MYNLRSKTRKGEFSSEQIYDYSSGDMPGKDLRIILNRNPLLENPSNHNCTFQIKNEKTRAQKEEVGYTEKIILFLIFFGLIMFGMLAINIYYKDEYKTYRTYLGRRLVLLPNELRTLTLYLTNTVHVKWNDILGGKRYGAVLKKREKSVRLKKRSDMCYNDIRDFIGEPWVSMEGRIERQLSFIEEQCMNLNLVPKTADHAQFSFNETNITHDTDVNTLSDYASYDKGARILSTSGAEPYVEYKVQSRILQYILGIKYFNVDELPLCRISETLCRHIPTFVTGPFSLLQPWSKPGECWSFKGSRGRVQIELSERIFITAVTLEHVPDGFASTGNFRSAPAQFSLIGIDTEGYKFTSRNYLGTYRYLLHQPNIQTFILSKEDSSHPYKIIEFNIESNHGNENYTCVYRLRVHGRPISSLQNQ